MEPLGIFEWGNRSQLEIYKMIEIVFYAYVHENSSEDEYLATTSEKKTK